MQQPVYKSDHGHVVRSNLIAVIVLLIRSSMLALHTVSTLFFIFQLTQWTHGLDVKVVLRIVMDIIDNERYPSELIAKTCWSKRDNFHFAHSTTVPMKIVNDFIGSEKDITQYRNMLWFFVDMNCKDAVSFLHDTDSKYFSHPYRWILFQPDRRSLENMRFLVDSNVILVDPSNDSARFDIGQGI